MADLQHVILNELQNKPLKTDELVQAVQAANAQSGEKRADRIKAAVLPLLNTNQVEFTADRKLRRVIGFAAADHK